MHPAAREVFLATMGSVAAHTARASFATNLFAAGGIAVEASGATATTDDVLRAYAGQPVVCLAGPDAAYADWGADLVAALRAAGASWVIVMGKTGRPRSRRLLRRPLRRSRVPDPHEGEAGMSVPKSFAGLPLVGEVVSTSSTTEASSTTEGERASSTSG